MARRRGPPSHGWKTFLHNHADGIAAIDLFVVPTVSFRLLYGLLTMGHSRRRADERRNVIDDALPFVDRPARTPDAGSASWKGSRHQKPRIAPSSITATSAASCGIPMKSRRTIGLADVLRLELELPIDFHRDTMRQLGGPNRRAGMLAGLWPKQLVKKSDAPSITSGMRSNPGATLTMPNSRTTRLIRSRSPNSCFRLASIDKATARAVGIALFDGGDTTDLPDL